MHQDKFGRNWNLPSNERCPVCGQPDSCGDCNHQKLSLQAVLIFNGTPSVAEILKLKTMPEPALKEFIKKAVNRYKGLSKEEDIFAAIRHFKSPRFFTPGLMQ